MAVLRRGVGVKKETAIGHFAWQRWEWTLSLTPHIFGSRFLNMWISTEALISFISWEPLSKWETQSFSQADFHSIKWFSSFLEVLHDDFPNFLRNPHIFSHRFQTCGQNFPLKPWFSDFIGIIIQKGDTKLFSGRFFIQSGYFYSMAHLSPIFCRVPCWYWSFLQKNLGTSFIKVIKSYFKN